MASVWMETKGYVILESIAACIEENGSTPPQRSKALVLEDQSVAQERSRNLWEVLEHDNTYDMSGVRFLTGIREL